MVFGDNLLTESKLAESMFIDKNKISVERIIQKRTNTKQFLIHIFVKPTDTKSGTSVTFPFTETNNIVSQACNHERYIGNIPRLNKLLSRIIVVI